MMFLPPDVEKCVLDLTKNAEQTSHDPRYKNLSEAYDFIANCLRYSVKVVLPDNGEVYRHNNAGGVVPSSDEAESLRGPPAPATSFIYRWTNFDPTEKPDGQCYGTKRITLVLDGKQIVEDLDPDLHNGMMMFSMFYAENFRRWDISPVAFCLRDPYTFAMIDRDKVILNRSPYGEYSWTWAGGGIDLLRAQQITADVLQKNKSYSDAFCEIRPDINAVVQCLHSLRAGASLKEQRHESASRRKKMERKGVGGFTYHILEVPNGGSKSNRQGGTHASPRLHVRRAHIRKLPSGALTFVRQCFVGDKSRGVVSKDYAMGRLA